MAQIVKNLPAMWDKFFTTLGKEYGQFFTTWDTWVQFLGWEDLVENGMVTHSSILTWRIPWAEEPGRLQSMGSQRVTDD